MNKGWAGIKSLEIAQKHIKKHHSARKGCYAATPLELHWTPPSPTSHIGSYIDQLLSRKWFFRPDHEKSLIRYAKLYGQGTKRWLAFCRKKKKKTCTGKVEWRKTSTSQQMMTQLARMLGNSLWKGMLKVGISSNCWTFYFLLLPITLMYYGSPDGSIWVSPFPYDKDMHESSKILTTNVTWPAVISNVQHLCCEGSVHWIHSIGEKFSSPRVGRDGSIGQRQDLRLVRSPWLSWQLQNWRSESACTVPMWVWVCVVGSLIWKKYNKWRKKEMCTFHLWTYT